MTLAERVRGWSGRGEFPTLGWGVLEWMTAHLPSPSDHAAELVLTDEQARIVLQFYRLAIDLDLFRKVPDELRIIILTAQGPILAQDGWQPAVLR